MELRVDEIVKASGAKVIKNTLSADAKFGISTDTRNIKDTEIYLPLKGDKFDGEDFIKNAIEAGSFAFFCTKKEKAEKFEASSDCKLILKVKNTLDAYLNLARFCRRKINPKTIAITGSSGKTTTKEMAYCVASQQFKTHKSELNYNNEIGLSKTILSMPEDTEILILEMGMRGVGEINLLSKYAEPDIALIANVGSAHLGRLGSKENIAKAKCEIVDYLSTSGTLIAHDNKLIKNIVKDIQQNIIYFSLDEAKIIQQSIGYSKFEYKGFVYELNIEGDYNVQNALSVIEMGLQLGIQEKTIAEGLKKYKPIEKRWEVEEIKGYKIINDSYNANPESMQGVIKTAFDLYAPELTIVLGDMGELGANEKDYHQEIGKYIIELFNDIKRQSVVILTVGNLAKEITKELKNSGFKSENFENHLQISRYILDNVKFGNTIVFKASRAMKLEEIIENIKNTN